MNPSLVHRKRPDRIPGNEGALRFAWNQVILLHIIPMPDRAIPIPVCLGKDPKEVTLVWLLTDIGHSLIEP